MSVQIQIEARLKHIRKGIPFTLTGFYSLGSTAAVQKSMSRLVQKGEIVRVSRGVYARPKPLKSIPTIKATANAEQMAKLWAKEHGYKLAPQGLEEAYRLGLQTQAPIRKVFWTNGPSREFAIGNNRVQVKTVSNNLLRWLNRPEGALLRGLVIMAKYEVTAAMLKTAFKRLGISENQINPILKKLADSQILKATNSHLHQLAQLA